MRLTCVVYRPVSCLQLYRYFQLL